MSLATDAAKVALEHWQFEKGIDDTESLVNRILQFRADLRELENEIKDARVVPMDGPTEETMDPCPECGSPLEGRMSGVRCGVCGYSFCY